MKPVIFKIWFVVFPFAILGFKATAQDPQFSQFYSATVDLGPSFAGSSSTGGKAVLNFRDQWPQIPKEYITYSASGDIFVPRFNSGIGAFVLRDHAGSGTMYSTNAGLQYSYFVDLTRKIQFRPGLQINYVSRNINYNRLIFGDQLSFYGIKPVSTENLSSENISLLDFTSSLLLFTKNIWTGISFAHLPYTNFSFTQSENKIPVKFSSYGGVKLLIRERFMIIEQQYLYISYLYKRQSKFNQLDLGLYWEKYPVMLGLWYRGLPIFKSLDKYIDQDALICKVGFSYDNLTFRYSYDFTLSQIRPVTGGAHEVSVVFLFDYHPAITKKRNSLPCPSL